MLLNKKVVFQIITWGLIVFLNGCAKKPIQTEDSVPNYIGKRDSQISKPYYTPFGACLTDLQKDGRFCKYYLSIIYDRNTSQPVSITAKKLIQKDAKESIQWVIKDQMSYPKIKEPYYFAYGTCLLNGTPDKTILAVAKNSSRNFHTVNKYAWKLNTKTGKINEISPAGIKCRNYMKNAISIDDIELSPTEE